MKYLKEEPMVRVVRFSVSDIITTSPGPDIYIDDENVGGDRVQGRYPGDAIWTL